MEWWLIHALTLLVILVASWLLRRVEDEGVVMCIPFWIIIITGGILYLAGQFHQWSTLFLLLAWPAIGGMAVQGIYRDPPDRRKWFELPLVGIIWYGTGIVMIPLSIIKLAAMVLDWLLEYFVWRSFGRASAARE